MAIHLHAVYNGQEGVGWKCQNADGHVVWYFAPNEFLDAAFDLDAISIEGQHCNYCAWSNPADQGSRVQQMLGTLSVSNNVTTFTMTTPVSLFHAGGSYNANAGDSAKIQMVCNDAAHTVNLGSGAYKFGGGAATLTVAFFRYGTGIVAMGAAWDLMQRGGDLATRGYAVYKALGC